MNPNPPATFKSIKMCSKSAGPVAYGAAASAAAMKANSMTRPKKSNTKSTLTRKVPIMITKLTMHMVMLWKTWEDSYGAPVAPPRPSALGKAEVIW